MSREQFEEIVIREADATQLRKNRAFSKPPCARTIKTIRKELKRIQGPMTGKAKENPGAAEAGGALVLAIV